MRRPPERDLGLRTEMSVLHRPVTEITTVQPLRLGFIAPGNPGDLKGSFGMPYFAFAALQDLGHEVISVDAGPQMWSRQTLWINRQTMRVFNRSVLVFEPWHKRRMGSNTANAQIRDGVFDALICMNVDPVIPLLKTDVPIIHSSDTTFAAIESYYDSYQNIWSLSRKRANAITSAALSRASLVSFPSDWAARSAHHDYGIAEDKIAVIPYGANTHETPPATQARDRNTQGVCHLLFIGGNWLRKGGPTAYRAMRLLREAGLDARLTVVGCDPGIVDPHMRVIPYLSKQVPADLELYGSLWREAAFLFMPTEQETFGAVFAEAAAHGVPVIARETGGISGCVADCISGRLLPQAAAPEAYADEIRRIWSDPAEYGTLVQGARYHYETVLNWTAWAKGMADLAHRAVREQRAQVGH